MSTRINLRLPAGVYAERVAGGRVGAKRWSLYTDPHKSYDSWLGDFVRFMPEDEWVWQPKDRYTAPDGDGHGSFASTNPDECVERIRAAVGIAAAKTVHNYLTSRGEFAEEESYASLADEMNDPDVGPWVESDWDPQAVAEAKKYAKENDLPWPPQTGDFDRYYEAKHN